jgi:hypothetical protein
VLRFQRCRCPCTPWGLLGSICMIPASSSMLALPCSWQVACAAQKQLFIFETCLHACAQYPVPGNRTVRPSIMLGFLPLNHLMGRMSLIKARRPTRMLCASDLAVQFLQRQLHLACLCPALAALCRCAQGRGESSGMKAFSWLFIGTCYMRKLLYTKCRLHVTLYITYCNIQVYNNLCGCRGCWRAGRRTSRARRT